MLRKIAISTVVAGAFALPFAGPAEAAVGGGAIGLSVAAAQFAPVQQVQFFYDGRNYCWYDDGWQGPGFYLCGFAWNEGYGWGGGYGWNGWRGSAPHCRHPPNVAGWYPPSQRGTPPANC